MYSEDSFDPDMFDPDALTGSQQAIQQVATRAQSPQGVAMAGSRGQFDVIITCNMTAASNPNSSVTPIELFNHDQSFAICNNPEINLGNRTVSGMNYEDFANDAARVNKIMFTQSGDLVITGVVNGGVLEMIRIRCKQIPYRALLAFSSKTPFIVNGLRLVVPPTNLSQIDEDFNHAVNTFLGGTKKNPFSPRSNFKPTDFQTNVVDILAKFPIDNEKGLRWQIRNSSAATSTEQNTISFFVPMYRKAVGA